MAGRYAGVPNKDKPFRDALRMEIAEAQADENPRSLRLVARKLLDRALSGDVQAIKEIGDRLDGKPAQAITGDNELDPIRVIQEIRRSIVDPKHTDSKGVPPTT
ncbi:MAG: hypothetical protein KGL39_20250 [Patescibacteria group bacterium]|nr:hypothetical protein [Patescibacteria group bacterium]